MYVHVHTQYNVFFANLIKYTENIEMDQLLHCKSKFDFKINLNQNWCLQF